MLSETRADRLLALPGEHYHSEREYLKERERIHKRAWWCVGHTSEWARPGDFKRYELFGESVLVVADRSGELHAMINICQHRGAQVCADEQGNVGRVLRCPYHGWTYRHDGSVLGAPSKNAFEQDVRERGLPTVLVEEWLGFVWVNLNPDAGPLATHMDPMLAMRFGEHDVLGRYRLDELSIARTIDYGTVNANWKLLWENFSECYHCPALHNSLCTAVPQFSTGYGTVTGPKGQGAQLAEGYAGFSTTGQMTGSLLPGLSESESSDFFGALMWPAAQVVCVSDHAVLLRMIPEAADRTRVVGHWLFQPADLTSPGFDPGPAVELFDKTNREDFDACERMQRGTESTHWAASQIYSPFEYRIESFREWVDAAHRCEDDLAAAYVSAAGQPPEWSSITHFMGKKDPR